MSCVIAKYGSVGSEIPPFAFLCRHQGKPVLAACCHLTVNDANSAVTCLLLGHEPEQAVALAQALSPGVTPAIKARALGAAACKCEAAG